MELFSLCLGMVQTNCYLLKKEGHALVIDPGDTFDIHSFLKQEELVLDGVLLTHAHFDHIKGVDFICDAFSCPVYVHSSETTFLKDPYYNASQSFYETIICHTEPKSFREGKLKIGVFDIEVIHTPGHTCGSCCFLIDGILFSGDTLFQGSIGRMDLPTGSVIDMKKSLVRLSMLPESLKVYPGHGNPTSIGIEKNINYEMKNL